MKLKIKYPDHIEAVEAEPAGEHFRLKEHAYFLPLAPGDIVSAENGVVTGVVSREPVFMIEAYFPINTPPEHVRAKAREWRLATNVCQPTALTVVVSSRSHQWLKDTVEPAVWWIELRRTPGADFDYLKEVSRQ